MKHAIPFLLVFLSVSFERLVSVQQSPVKAASSNQSEPSPKREGMITGRIIGADGQPVARVGVYAYRLSEIPGPGRSVVSDEDGNFKLTSLSPGAYTLFAESPGYVSADLPIENAIHRIGEFVTINMLKGSVITGRVTDETGEPLVGVNVLSHRLRDLEGKSTGSQAGMYNHGFATTDDRGIYRIYGIRAGVYIVNIGVNSQYSPDGIQVRRDAPTYYPSATRDTAAEINLRVGEEASGIDIRHRGQRGRIVSGVVSGEIESSYQSISLTLSNLETDRIEAETNTNLSNSRGFAFYGVPDGEYEITATQRDGREPSSSGSRRVSVIGVDVGGVELKLAPLGSISGRIVIESLSAPRCSIDRGPDDNNQASARIQEQDARRTVVEEIVLRAERDELNRRVQKPRSYGLDRYGRVPNQKGEFALKHLEAGRYRIAVNLPNDDWHIRAIIQPGVGSARQSTRAGKSHFELMRSGIAIKPGEKFSGVEVIIAEGAAALNGRVVPAKGELASRLRAHLIPAEDASADEVLRYAETDVRDDGSFAFKHITPGKYLIHPRQVAENQIRPAAWDTSEYTKLRRDARPAKNEIQLQPCARVKDYVVRYSP